MTTEPKTTIDINTPPTTAQEYSEQGVILWRQGDQQTAEKYFRKAYELAPDLLPAILNYSTLLLKEKQNAQAEILLRKAIEQAPTNAEIYDKLGHALYEQGKLHEAIPVLHTAIKLKPNWFPPIHKLGTCLINVNNLAEALFWMEKAVNLEPRNVYSRLNYGSTLDRAGYHEEAREEFYKIIDMQPDFASAYFNILSSMEKNHKLEDMEKLIEKAEKNIPNTQTLAIIKARLAKREKNYAEGIAYLEPLKDEKSEISADLLYELGLLYDRVHEYDKAYEVLERANQLRLKDPRYAAVNFESFPHMAKTLSEPFSKEWVQSWGPSYPSDQYKTPHFIFGFPRSGTTLTGQILDSHPSLYVADEVDALEYARTYMATTHINTYPNCLASLGLGDIEKMRAIFYANHRNETSWPENQTLVDKHPLDIVRAGMAHRMFPDAKMIFVARHPCDCILSNFMQNFGMNNAMVHMTSIETAVSLYMMTLDIWNKYKESMPDLQTHTIRYEDLVNDFNGEVAKMLEFLDLEWNDSVLEYNKNAKKNPRVNTPSYSQITEPIYKRAAYRWENYRKYFEPYLEQLKPYIEDLGYTA